MTRMSDVKDAPRTTPAQFGIGSPTVAKSPVKTSTDQSPRTMKLVDG